MFLENSLLLECSCENIYMSKKRRRTTIASACGRLFRSCYFPFKQFKFSKFCLGVCLSSVEQSDTDLYQDKHTFKCHDLFFSVSMYFCFSIFLRSTGIFYLWITKSNNETCKVVFWNV